jgi:hypothetical protein
VPVDANFVLWIDFIVISHNHAMYARVVEPKFHLWDPEFKKLSSGRRYSIYPSYIPMILKKWFKTYFFKIVLWSKLSNFSFLMFLINEQCHEIFDPPFFSSNKST